MRYLLTAGVLAFFSAGTGAFASAAQSVAAIYPTASAAVATAKSPDLDQWTQPPATVTPKMQVVRAPKRAVHPRHISRLASRLVAKTNRIAKSLTSNALRFLGTPYVFGGTTGYGFDCSGFTQHVYGLMGYRLPRTADAQYYDEHRAKGGPKVGDLVFFQTYEPGPSHVGIYLGSGRFVHASSSHGVTISRLSDSYWSARYIGSRRVL